MRCRKCETPNPPERTHCSKCGAKLPPPPHKAAGAEALRAKPRRPPEEEYDEVEVVEEVEEVKPRPRRRREADEDDERPRKHRRREEEYDDEEEPHRRRRREEDDEEDYDDEDYDEDEDVLKKFIPSDNRSGLIGYYCAVFSVIPAVVFPIPMFTHLKFPDDWGFILLPLPIVGIALGLGGIVFGALGLAHSRANPQARGGGHAATGLFLGTFTMLECAILLILFLARVLPFPLI